MINKHAVRPNRRAKRPKSVDIPIWETPDLPGNPRIIERDAHNLSRKLIDQDVLKIMRRLRHYGHQVFLVGGSVRDILLGIEPKDFDLSTDATPQRIRKLFRNSRIIGRRFKLNHIFFQGNKIIETTTFRAPEELDEGDDSPITKDNTYGDAESDAFRRDLTINALFYDLKTFSIIDYVGGVEDIEKKLIRLIGDPEKRIIADPVRMIRSVRHAARTGFKIEPKTKKAIVENVELIHNSSKARVYEELVRDLKRGKAFESFSLFKELGLFEHLLPIFNEAVINGAWDDFSAVLKAIDGEILRRNEIELSTAVVFLALSIEVLNKTSIIEAIGESTRKRINAVFSLVPAASSDQWIADDKIPVKKVEEIIDKVFKPLGVSNKDREEMRDLLLTRYDMLKIFMEEEDPRGVIMRHHFDHALDLLKLTSHTKQAKKCLDYWLSVADERSAEEKRPRMPLRKRRPRRRKKIARDSDGNK